MTDRTKDLVSYSCIVADPPWQQVMTGAYKNAGNHRPANLPYSTMTINQIMALPVGEFAANGAHLWLWTTNQHLISGTKPEASYALIESVSPAPRTRRDGWDIWGNEVDSDIKLTA